MTMIVQWKAVSQDEFQATWAGMLLCLARDNERWRLWLYPVKAGDTLEVNGLPGAAARGRWATAAAAKEAVDGAMNRVLRARMAAAADKGAAVREYVGNTAMPWDARRREGWGEARA